MKNPPLWEDDKVQFARLIAELEAAGVFELDDSDTMRFLRESMDLETHEIMDIVERAALFNDRVNMSIIRP